MKQLDCLSPLTGVYVYVSGMRLLLEPKADAIMDYITHTHPHTHTYTHLHPSLSPLWYSSPLTCFCVYVSGMRLLLEPKADAIIDYITHTHTHPHPSPTPSLL